jgi:hypothetical protein
MILLAERSFALWHSAARLREVGASTAAYFGHMTFPTLAVTAVNGGICAALFAVGWFASSLVG